MSSLLRAEAVTMQFGGLRALQDVSFTVPTGQITAIIGPNGAGKTTLFNCLTGFYRPSAGRFLLHQTGGWLALEKLPAHAIARRARIARTFQNIRLFHGLSVLENLLVAMHQPLMQASAWSLAGLLRLPGYRRAEERAQELCGQLLQQFDLVAVADQPAAALPYGQRKRLEIARALALQPALLCLDEPAAGLNPSETASLARQIRALAADNGLTILLIEHDMRLVMGISDQVVVLDHGCVIAHGPPAQVRRDPAVIRAYLGSEQPDAET